MNDDMNIKDLISRYVDGEVTPEEKEIVEKHLKEAPALYAYYQELKGLDGVLNKNKFIDASPDWENQVQLSLLNKGVVEAMPIIKRSKLLKVCVISCLLLAFTMFSSATYVFNLEKFVSLQDTLVYAQDQYESGSKAGLRVVALNSKDSKPIADADVVVAIQRRGTKQEEVLYKGKASTLGSPEIRFDMPDYPSGEYDLLIKMDSKYGHNKIIKPIKLKKSSKILLTTDKPLYQPGQTIHVRALALKNTDSTPMKDQELTFEVEDPKGNKVFKKKVQTSPFGVAAITFTLASEINMGEYTIRAVAPDYSAEKKVEVKRYVLPKFKVSFSTDKTYYLPDQKLKGTVQANYFFGKVTSNAKVKIEMRTFDVNMQLLGAVNGTTNAEGVFEFEYALPQYFVGLPLEKGAARLFFDVSVVDQAQHAEQITRSVPVAKDPIGIELVPESGDLVPGLENIVYVATTYPDGKPASATVHYKGQNIQTNQFGIGEIKVTGIPFNSYSAQTYSISATAEDVQGNKGGVSKNLPVRFESNIPTTESVLLRTDRSILNVGDTLNLQVFCSQPRGTVYLDVIKNKQTVLTKALTIDNRIAELALDLDEAMSGTLELHAYKILRDSNIVRDTKTIFVNHNNDLKLQVSSDKGTYLPGETAKITFSTSKDQKGVASAVGVNIVDESVFALQEKEPGFERLYFALEKELMTPRATIYGLTLPGMIGEGPLGMDEPTRIQAGHIILAGIQPQGQFPLTFSSRIENTNRIQAQKGAFFGWIIKILFGIFILLPLSAFVVTAYEYRRRKLLLLMDLGGAILVLLGAVLLMALILFLLFWSVAGTRSYMLGPILSIGILAAAVIGFIVSFIILTRHAQRHNPALLWVNIAGLSYVLLTLLLFAIAAIGSSSGMELFENNSGSNTLIIFLVGALFAIVYAKYALDFIKEKKRLAYLALIMALVFAQIFTVIPLQIYVKRGLQGRLKSAADDIGDQFSAPGTLQYEPCYMNTKSAEDRSDVNRGEGGSGKKAQPNIRQFFPETLYSNPQIITDDDGKATVDVKLADSITSWRLTALANSLAGNIGSSDLAMVVFQDFFVDIDLPVTLTQEDEVSIPVSVYNYLKTSQTASLELKKEDWFELTGAPTQTLNIEANGIDVVYFRIKAKKLGLHKLTVLANGEKKSDAISRTIEIVPDGKEVKVSYSDMLDNDVEKKISVPQEAIDDSEKLFIKIYPGLFSQVVEGLDSLLQMPYGCFEQTSSTTYPNVLALDYMKSIKQITPQIEMKAEHFISAGYQRLLTFEAEKGGFSIFGQPPAEKIVTAYGLMEFSDMSRVYDIDSNLIPRIQDWLLSRVENDHWTPDGHYGAAYKARNSNVGATSYILWALLSSGRPANDPKVQKALDFIEREYVTEKDNPYTLALVALSLSKAKRNAQPVLDRLNGLAQRDTENDTISWKTNDVSGHGDDGYYYGRKGGNLADVETTAMVALAYMQENYRLNELSKTMKFLVKSKDAQGNWGSTQATVLALKVLIGAVTKSSEGVNAKIAVFVDGKSVQEIMMNDENKDVLQLIDLKSYAKKGDTDVKIQFQGKGGLFYQLVSSYYSKWEDVGKYETYEPGIKIELNYDKVELNTNDTVTANVYANYVGEGVVKYAMLDLGIPPGFQVQTDGLVNAVKEKLIEKFEVTGRQLIIYLVNLDEKGVHLNYHLKAKFPIKGKTPQSSVYDYYDPSVRKDVGPVEMTVH
ncbi:MAG: zf-HC2 domain-containing protein [Candidatus Omnitrophica bacterium]|nr:zf-HC2 domain-containing protein [Candidatus Omnitrophota bacterium]